jgi:hypothetical protein
VLRVVVVGPVQGRTTLLGPVAVVFVNTVKVAQLVTLLQKPETFTQYWPASPLTTDGIV